MNERGNPGAIWTFIRPRASVWRFAADAWTRSAAPFRRAGQVWCRFGAWHRRPRRRCLRLCTAASGSAAAAAPRHDAFARRTDQRRRSAHCAVGSRASRMTRTRRRSPSASPRVPARVPRRRDDDGFHVTTPVIGSTAVGLELGRCDQYLEQVRERAPKTRLSNPWKPRLPRRSRARDEKNRRG